MPTENDIREAYERAVKKGTHVEHRRLRTFTGLPYIIVPDDSVAEHLSYPDYEQRLLNVIAQEEQEEVRLQRNRDRAGRNFEAAQAAYAEVLDTHRQRREVAGVFGKIRSIATEPFLREKTQAKEAEEDLFELDGEINDQGLKLVRLRAERIAVTQWVDDLYSTTRAAGERRAELQVNASRDITWGRFQTFGMAEYLEADDQRRLSWGPEMPGGADFGYKWRRDGDDEHAYQPADDPWVGRWRAVWIEGICESAVFISAPNRPGQVLLLGNHIRTYDEALNFFRPLECRQHGRNSLGLLMDVYTERYL